MNKKIVITLVVVIVTLNYSFSQIIKVIPTTKIAGYASIVHPIATFNKDGTTFNFSKSYTVGFPFGINILKGEKAGVSFEFAPFIKAADGTSRVSNFLFHPGYMFRFTHGYTFITRLAFGTDGRYGVTPVFAKVFLRRNYGNYFVSASLPFRTGTGTYFFRYKFTVWNTILILEWLIVK